MNEITYSPIGKVHSDYTSKDGMPIQSAFADGSKGTVEIKKEYTDALLGLDEFSHIYLIYHFHLMKSNKLVTKPFMRDLDLGVFAIRSPVRPNGIGLSVVRLEKIEDNILYINDVDIMDGTPLLDIKPYISRFDIRTDVKNGWIEGRTENKKKQVSDKRFE